MPSQASMDNKSKPLQLKSMSLGTSWLIFRKEILKKLERKKKLAPIIHDELYSYLEKFP